MRARVSVARISVSQGASFDRTRPNPRGKRPSIAALTRAGERKASDIVIRIERSVFPSRAAPLPEFGSSMGRLTLNVLLSFAQFERDLKATIQFS
jgi:hypothetical protein